MSVYIDETGKEYQKPETLNPEWRLSGYVLIKSGQGKILMVQPTWDKNWELPGGGIQKEETIKAGIVRECYEETGYKVQIHGQPISVGERNFYSQALDKFFKAVIMIYEGNLADEKQNRAVINTVEKNEIAQVAWVDPTTLHLSNVHPIVWPTISQLLKLQK